jgi:hypothetical protein
MSRTVQALAWVAALSLAACESTPSGVTFASGGGNALAVSAANPADADGSLTNLQVSADPNASVAEGPATRVTITGSVDTVQQQVDVFILQADNSIPHVEHAWGADLANPEGHTVCDVSISVGPPCPPSQVVSNGSGSVTFAGLQLGGDAGDGDVSTLTGGVEY